VVQLGKMPVETALFLEPVQEIYERVFRSLKPHLAVPAITVRFRKYANANSRIRLADGQLTVDISDLLKDAPAPVHEALAHVLLGKLYRKALDPGFLARYGCKTLATPSEAGAGTQDDTRCEGQIL
jgi:hypothetical protein